MSLEESNSRKTTVISERSLRRLLLGNFEVSNQKEIIYDVVNKVYDGKFTKFIFRLIKSECGIFRNANKSAFDLPSPLTTDVLNLIRFPIIRDKAFKDELGNFKERQQVIRFIHDLEQQELLDIFHNEEVNTYAKTYVSQNVDINLIDWVEISDIFNKFLNAFLIIVVEAMKIVMDVKSKHGYTLMSFELYDDKLFITFT